LESALEEDESEDELDEDESDEEESDEEDELSDDESFLLDSSLELESEPPPPFCRP
jgi:hypothetical protein